MDKMAPATAIRKLVNKLNVQENIAVDYYVLNEANHIFSGHIDKITMVVKDYVTKAIMAS
ncbi:MAG: alpha/beta hydrolase, partial [Acetobacter sp.]|nr:alpha/beta hydrolase [Acetobacter sp.]